MEYSTSSAQTSNPNSSRDPSATHSDLSTASSLLNDIIVAAESAIGSASSSCLLNSNCWKRDSEFVSVCPYDPHHRMPPESLFRHSLICPSSPGVRIGTPLRDNLGFILSNLRYPSSLKPESELKKENRFNYSLPPPVDDDADSNLCFSLDGDCACEPPLDPSRFFYKDCPGVVSLNPEPDDLDISSNKTFLLPAFLSAECANFVHHHPRNGNDVDVDVDGGVVKLLPSDFWALKSQVKAWTDYPTSYSYIVLRVASTSSLNQIEDCGLKRWVISSSPRFGILIDSAMRDHVFLLFKLCLKAIRTEALCSLRSISRYMISISNLKAMAFESPKLVRSLAWLASQLSVLYGESNGKFFALEMLKEILMRVGLNSMLFNFGQEKCGQHDRESIIDNGYVCKGHEHLQSKPAGCLEPEKSAEDCDGGQVFISQIAAAVASIHERFFLEEKIKALRSHQLLSRSQLLNEYLNASTRACAIREQRPEYRAVSEHDGLRWHVGNNQDLGKTKTREELLAEERDYKRRRMSYRGKKAKRSTTEVLRDIIEEHMEEIIQAGGIGYTTATNVDVVGVNQNPSDRTVNAHEFKHIKHDVTEGKLDSPGYEQAHHLHSNGRPKIIKDLKCPKKEVRFKCSEHQEGLEGKKYKEAENWKPTSPSVYRYHDNLHNQFTHLNEHSDSRTHATLLHKNVSFDNSGYTNLVNELSLESACVITNQGQKHISETRSANRKRTEYLRSKSVTITGFEDRYDPSTAYDEHDDSYGDISVSDAYLRSKQHHHSMNNA